MAVGERRSQQKNLVQCAREKAYRWVGFQLLIIIIVSLLWLFKSWHATYSSFFGGMASLIPNLIFAYFFFGRIQSRNKQILTAFYVGELLKIALSVVMLFIMLSEWQLAMLPVFVGFLAAHFGLWVRPFIEARATSG